MRILVLASLLWILPCAAAWAAGGSATIIAEGASGPARISWLNNQTVRVDVPGQPGYMLVRDGHAYTISSVAGRMIALDMATMSRFLYGPNPPRLPASPANARSVSQFKATGGHATIAGITGDEYTLTWTDTDNVQHTDDVILSADPRAVAMTRAFRSFASTLAAATGVSFEDALGKALDDRGLGILRFGTRYRVKTINATAPPASGFALPVQSLQLPLEPSGTTQ